jgi:hypothetical protein
VRSRRRVSANLLSFTILYFLYPLRIFPGNFGFLPGNNVIYPKNFDIFPAIILLNQQNFINHHNNRSFLSSLSSGMQEIELNAITRQEFEHVKYGLIKQTTSDTPVDHFFHQGHLAFADIDGK